MTDFTPQTIENARLLREDMDRPFWRFFGRSLTTWPEQDGGPDTLHNVLLCLEQQGFAVRIAEFDRGIHWKIS